jgi:hypothetical protein
MNYSWLLNSYMCLNYLKLAVQSIRDNAYYKNQPILIYTENDLDTYEWAKSQPDVTAFYEKNSTPRGIGGGVNFYG